jgi:hypothetical protein
MPPNTPKLPPVTGARALMDERAPTRRSPCSKAGGERVEPLREKTWTHARRVTCSLHTVPNTATDRTHGKRRAGIVQDDPGTAASMSEDVLHADVSCIPGIAGVVGVGHVSEEAARTTPNVSSS